MVLWLMVDDDLEVLSWRH